MVIFSNAFIILRQRAKRVEHECYVNYITTVENSMHDNLKAFWSYDQANKRSPIIMIMDLLVQKIWPAIQVNLPRPGATFCNKHYVSE